MARRFEYLTKLSDAELVERAVGIVQDVLNGKPSMAHELSEIAKEAKRRSIMAGKRSGPITY